MNWLTPSNSKETPVFFQELVRLTEHAKIQEENENFPHRVIGLNPSSWTDFLLQLAKLGCTHMQPPQASFASANQIKAFET